MSFKNFIYYCALAGGWAAFAAWGLVEAMGIFSAQKEYGDLARSAITSAMVGLFVASTIGMLDALLNAVGFQRVIRTGVCLIVGMFGGLVGGAIGQALYGPFENPAFRVLGWAIVGIAIGASIGVFDVQRAVLTKQPLGQARRKMINGMIGGTVGGVLGGVMFEFVRQGIPTVASLVKEIDRSAMLAPRAIGLVILGVCIGLLIGTAQVMLKEAWVKVEAGFKAGREMMLSKPETTAGRGEGNDIGLFGDNGVDKQHCKIVLQGGRYVLVEVGSPSGGTFVNGERISGPTPLRSGDLIGLGKSALRFGERAKRN